MNEPFAIEFPLFMWLAVGCVVFLGQSLWMSTQMNKLTKNHTGGDYVARHVSTIIKKIVVDMANTFVSLWGVIFIAKNAAADWQLFLVLLAFVPMTHYVARALLGYTDNQILFQQPFTTVLMLSSIAANASVIPAAIIITMLIMFDYVILDKRYNPAWLTRPKFAQTVQPS